jgi:hypothetical protein
MFLQKFADVVADGMMKWYNGWTCELFVFQLWFQFLAWWLLGNVSSVVHINENLYVLFFLHSKMGILKLAAKEWYLTSIKSLCIVSINFV